MCSRGCRGEDDEGTSRRGKSAVDDDGGREAEEGERETEERIVGG